MDPAEATARAVRLERLADDLDLVQRECPGFAESAGEMLERVRHRFTPEVWTGPAAERAFAGLQAVSSQSMWARQETPGPDEANLTAAQHQRYDIAYLVDPARMAGLAGNMYLPADVVADMLRLAVLTDTDRARAAQTLDGILANLGDCNKESKRLLAEAVVTHMDHLADVLNRGGPGKTNTEEGIRRILDDSQARAKVVDGAANYAQDGFSQVASGLAGVLAAHGEYTPEQAFAALPPISRHVLVKVGHILHAVAGWEGGSKSDLPGLLTAGFGIALAGAGTVVTGGVGTIVLAGVGAAAGVVGEGAQGTADQRVADRGAAHAQSVRDVAFYMAASSLLLNPGPPPLSDLLVTNRPNPGRYPSLFDAEKRLVIPQPGSKTWSEFYDWMTSQGNEKLVGAVDHPWRMSNSAPARQAERVSASGGRRSVGPRTKTHGLLSWGQSARSRARP